MTWRVPPFDQAVAELESYVRAKYSPEGIIVSGSIVRGEHGPASDLDVEVIHQEPWRLRDQKIFAGVPAEMFVNSPASIRRYFASEHKDAHPSTAHMLATGEVLGAPSPIVAELIAEAREWLAKPPPALTADQLTSQRYGAVDRLDDAKDIIKSDPAAAALLLAQTVDVIIQHLFRRAQRNEPRRKRAIAALTELDPVAGALVRRWAASTGEDALAIVAELARHAVGADAFFEWCSPQDPVSD